MQQSCTLSKIQLLSRIVLVLILLEQKTPNWLKVREKTPKSLSRLNLREKTTISSLKYRQRDIGPLIGSCLSAYRFVRPYIYLWIYAYIHIYVCLHGFFMCLYVCDIFQIQTPTCILSLYSANVSCTCPADCRPGFQGLSTFLLRWSYTAVVQSAARHMPRLTFAAWAACRRARQ